MLLIYNEKEIEQAKEVLTNLSIACDFMQSKEDFKIGLNVARGIVRLYERELKKGGEKK